MVNRILFGILRWIVISFILILPYKSYGYFPDSCMLPLDSLESYTGIWQMPNARILPDWHLRLIYGDSDPYSYFGGALGLFNRLEIHGQFTVVHTIDAFKGYGYGRYKDRSAGARLVLLKEDEFLPQIAIGAFDATGTALFAQRYLVMSKMIENFDITLGLGQGILAGEFIGGESRAMGGKKDTGFSFLFSSPFRKTRPFGGIEYHFNPHLIFSAEYSSINYEKMFGFIAKNKKKVKQDNSKIPFNFGIKYKIGSAIQAKVALMRGRWLGFGVNVDFPMDPEGFLGWKKEPKYKVYEKIRFNAYFATNLELARILADELKNDGFKDIRVAASDTSIWIEVENSKYISPLRALRRVIVIIDNLCPPRIKNFYINFKKNGKILTSIRTSRDNIRAYLNSRIDKTTFLYYSDINLYKDKNLSNFLSEKTVSEFVSPKERWWDFRLEPKIYTFINNRSGFFKHKGIIRTSLKLYPTSSTLLKGELELTLFNQYDELIFPPLEPEPTRTDMVLYEKQSKPRISQLAVDQLIEIPKIGWLRGALGYFEYGYAGFGIEGFRYFNDGRWGLGLESEVVKKRSIDDNFKLKKDSSTFYTGFINLYCEIWPSQGVEGGLKIGRFLAGDRGVMIILRRSFKYFTVGAWYTKTDTSIFKSDKNREAEEKGVYISFPFAVFSDREKRGTLTYGITSFTRDQGQTLRQPRYLFPLNPWDTPDYLKRNLDEIRGQ